MNDPKLINRIVIHDNKGNLVSSLEMEQVVIALQFLDNGLLLIVNYNGTYMLYNPWSKELSSLFYFTDKHNFAADPVFTAKAVDLTIIFITRGYKVFAKDIGKRDSTVLIYQPENDSVFYGDGISYFSVNSVRDPEPEIHVYLPLSRGGILKLTHSTKPKVERLLATVVDPFVRISISPSGENLAALTKSGNLIVIYLKNPTNVWNKALGIDEGELSFLQKIEWVAWFAVAMVFTNKIKLVCCGQEEVYFEPTSRDIMTTTHRTNFIITRSEIDGLRVIRIFDHYTKQNCCIIRRIPQSYSKLFFSYTTDKSSGKLLHEAYLAAVKEKPLDDQEDLRQYKAKLVEGVIELLECGTFELDQVATLY